MARLYDWLNDQVRNTKIFGSRLNDEFDHLWSSIPAAAAGFRAHKNGTNQTGLTHNNYTKLTFTTEAFDIGSYYDSTNSRWTPPAGLVEVQGHVLITAHAASLAAASPNFVLKLIKNGSTDVVAWQGNPLTGLSGFASVGFSCTDQASGTDFYELNVFFVSDDAGNDGVADGNAAHTWFSGKWTP